MISRRHALIVMASPQLNGAHHLRARAGEVHRHSAIVEGDRHLDAHRLVERDAVVVEVGDRAIRAGRDAGELGAGAALRLLEVDTGRDRKSVV